MDEIVKVNCLRHIYADRTEVKICGLDFYINSGERTVILGPNGSGKTTLLAHIMGLLEPVDGEVLVFGLNPKKHFKEVRKRIGVVFQNVDEQILGPTVWDDIAFAPTNYGLPPDEVREMTDLIMGKVGITHLGHKVPHYLSGGEKKKVAIAGAMVMKPEMLILDEPFDGLDPRSKEEMAELLVGFNEQFGTALVITTHDINIVPDIAQTIYILNKGRLTYRGTPFEVFSNTQILTEANLTPPLLVQLFHSLAARGLDLGIPADLEDAVEKIRECQRRQTIV